MRKLLTPRRSLLGASTLLLAASSLALLAPGGASAAQRNATTVTYTYYSDATMAEVVGSCIINYRCSGYHRCGGPSTPYYTVTTEECPA